MQAQRNNLQKCNIQKAEHLTALLFVKRPELKEKLKREDSRLR
ncbi:hypothetical protein EDD59_1403 [Muricomes intestini]|jgi:hypothetical protein|uniref:Uncharacterized protein n=1 Tax=Muricomes intestini TaxID=1796634 RepID=A0A4R3K198_9FIRM|nr:hypothetical protein EDD59_1403 [Muricomes intestini]